jgi:hypothetical protein
MSQLRARVHNGRLLVDEPTALPEGTVLDLVLDDEGDDLDDADRQALHDSLNRSWTSAQAGRTSPADRILERIRQR